MKIYLNKKNFQLITTEEQSKLSCYGSSAGRYPYIKIINIQYDPTYYLLFYSFLNMLHIIPLEKMPNFKIAVKNNIGITPPTFTNFELFCEIGAEAASGQK